jgi:hypothetical protein
VIRPEARRPGVSWSIPAVALVAALSACGPEQPAATPAAARDSAGVTIVENPDPDARGLTEWGYTQVLDIGAVGGDGPDAFYQVADAALLSDGRIAVADRGSSEIRFFDATGSFLGAAGRRGGGPGEFLDIQQLLRGPLDSLFVYDGKAQRVSVLTGDGTIVRAVPLFTGAVPGALLGRLPDGAWLAHTSDLPSKKFDIEPGLSRAPVHVIRIVQNEDKVDTIAAFPGREYFFQPAGKGATFAPPPFGRTARFAFDRDRLFVTTGTPEIREYDLGGRLLRILRTARSPVAVTPATVEAWVRERAARLPRVKMPADRSPEEAIRGSIEGVPVPPTLPPFGAMLTDPDGNLWVGDYQEISVPSDGWTVYGPDGTIRARVRLPAGLRLLDARLDHLLGTVLDDLDIEHVRLYRRR